MEVVWNVEKLSDENVLSLRNRRDIEELLKAKESLMSVEYHQLQQLMPLNDAINNRSLDVIEQHINGLQRIQQHLKDYFSLKEELKDAYPPEWHDRVVQAKLDRALRLAKDSKVT